MSVEFKFVGFFKDKNNEKLNCILNECIDSEGLSDYHQGESDDDYLKYLICGEQCYDAWNDAYAKIKSVKEPKSEYLIVTYCDHDDDGLPVEGFIKGEEISGYIPFGLYCELNETAGYDWFELADLIEKKLRNKDITLVEATDY